MKDRKSQGRKAKFEMRREKENNNNKNNKFRDQRKKAC
jgi:hypothetical protein